MSKLNPEAQEFTPHSLHTLTEEFNKLCSEPLNSTTDALRLKELEQRFPGATMVLTTDVSEYVVSYIYEDLYVDPSINDMISCQCCSHARIDFQSFGIKGTPQLSAFWNGLSINLSHLF